MHQQTLAQQSQALAKGDYSARELTSHYLQRIEQFDSQLNSFIAVTTEQALAQADAADAARKSGTVTSLTGVPLAHQDVFCSQGTRTSCGSKMLDNFIAPYNAHLLEQLQLAGSVSLGKTNMDEFAMTATGQSSFYGPTSNPWDALRISGGAASGSAVAVAAGLVAASTACDTFGDLRLPAAHNGLTGLKASYGRISRFGMTANASSFDQAGFITRTAEDAALLLQVAAGFDTRDSTCSQDTVADYNSSLNQPLSGLRIGIARCLFDASVDSRIADLVLASAGQLQQLGAILIDIELPHSAQSMACASIIGSGEASTNMSRFDGVRFGYRCADPADLDDLYQRSRGEAFGSAVQQRIMLGTHFLSANQYEDYYVQAQRVRRLIKQDLTSAFGQVDLILTPVTAALPRTASKTADPVSDWSCQRYTALANLAGLPALSMPCGQVDGLPVGTQLLAPWLQEARLLNAAHQYQQATDWHHSRPNGF